MIWDPNLKLIKNIYIVDAKVVIRNSKVVSEKWERVYRNTDVFSSVIALYG